MGEHCNHYGNIPVTIVLGWPYSRGRWYQRSTVEVNYHEHEATLFRRPSPARNSAAKRKFNSEIKVFSSILEPGMHDLPQWHAHLKSQMQLTQTGAGAGIRNGT